jgi:hypothetical protein
MLSQRLWLGSSLDRKYSLVDHEHDSVSQVLLVRCYSPRHGRSTNTALARVLYTSANLGQRPTKVVLVIQGRLLHSVSLLREIQNAAQLVSNFIGLLIARARDSGYATFSKRATVYNSERCNESAFLL